MLKTNVLSETRYARLVRDIRALVDEGREKAQQAVRRELAVTYWGIGKRITQEGLTERGGYGDAVLTDLSVSLGMHVTTLTRCISFFRAYNDAPRSINLTWSHYKHLIPLSDQKERAWYENLVEVRGLNRDQLARAIQNDRYAQSRGSLGALKVSEKLKRPLKATYIYKAWVKRVIDGDTLLLHVDLGFQVLKIQRVRLAVIDTEPLDTPGGHKAYRYVRDQMAKVDFVMVKTNKIDIYGRYVGHVFYSLTQRDKAGIFEQGKYLNQELLDKGLARLL